MDARRFGVLIEGLDIIHVAGLATLSTLKF